jgi:hypothetical protein
LAYDAKEDLPDPISRFSDNSDRFIHWRREVHHLETIIKSDDEINLLSPSSSSETSTGRSNCHLQASVEDLDEPEPKWLEHWTKPKALKHLLESVEDDDEEEVPSQQNGDDQKESTWEELGSDKDFLSDVANPPTFHALLGQTRQLFRGRNFNPGRSSAGVSVLSTKGWMRTPTGEPVDLWLNSCADVMLLSE